MASGIVSTKVRSERHKNPSKAPHPQMVVPAVLANNLSHNKLCSINLR